MAPSRSAEPVPMSKNELVTASQFHEETRRRLLWSGIRHAGAAGDNSHLVYSQIFASREIDITVGHSADGRNSIRQHCLGFLVCGVFRFQQSCFG